MYVAKLYANGRPGPWHLAVRKTPRGPLVAHCLGKPMTGGSGGTTAQTLPDACQICSRCAKAIAANLGVD